MRIVSLSNGKRSQASRSFDLDPNAKVLLSYDKTRKVAPDEKLQIMVGDHSGEITFFSRSGKDGSIAKMFLACCKENVDRGIAVSFDQEGRVVYAPDDVKPVLNQLGPKIVALNPTITRDPKQDFKHKRRD